MLSNEHFLGEPTRHVYNQRDGEFQYKQHVFPAFILDLPKNWLDRFSIKRLQTY